jgi:hypothetical protein
MVTICTTPSALRGGNTLPRPKVTHVITSTQSNSKTQRRLSSNKRRTAWLSTKHGCHRYTHRSELGKELCSNIWWKLDRPCIKPRFRGVYKLCMNWQKPIPDSFDPKSSIFNLRQICARQQRNSQWSNAILNKKNYTRSERYDTPTCIQVIRKST